MGILLNRVALIAALLAAGVSVAFGEAVSAVAAPARSASRLTYLYGVSCTSRAACTAFGYSDTAPPLTTSLAERWNGRKWVIQRTPNPRGSVFLYGVSCASRSACAAVGYAEVPGTALLAERWNGRKWAIQRTPSPRGSAVLYGVSCIRSNACTAVGFAGSSSLGHRSLAVRWNGRKWAIQRTPNRSSPSGGTYLDGVSCASRTACTAVGFVGDETIPEGDVSLAERWNGKNWVIQRTPDPPGTNNTNLNGVSCVSRTACTAVGYAANSTGVGAISLAERWNGRNWVIQRTPNPSGVGNDTTLSGVSCTSQSACTAVGNSYNGVTGAITSLAERWNGAKWVIQQTFNLPGHDALFYGVSCASGTACTAVGRFFSGGATGWTSLAERWNGTKWIRQHTPNP